MVDFEFENNVWEKGAVVGGMDEVGRGCLAGPVVTGIVVYTPTILSFQIPRIDDSKKLTARQRELASTWIKENCLTCGIGMGSVAEINKYGIVKATNKAFRRAILSANSKLESLNKEIITHLLIDAFYVPYIKGIPHANQTPIIKGDGKSFSIACASIIAKVHRDSLMASLSRQYKYKKYFWDENKGYGTLVHREAILKHGITPHHRTNFKLT